MTQSKFNSPVVRTTCQLPTPATDMPCGSYQRPTVERVGEWKRVTLVITIPIGPGGTDPIYSGGR